MTPAQLDHLTHLKNHLETLLANAEKRTPGEWSVEYSAPHEGKFAIIECARFRGGLLNCIDLGEDHETAEFIAACAGNAERAYRSTLSAIRALRYLSQYSAEAEACGCYDHARKSLADILTEWPLEVLK